MSEQRRATPIALPVAGEPEPPSFDPAIGDANRATVTDLAHPATPSSREPPSPSDSEAPVGEEPADRYTLLKELSRGGQGIVYLAYDAQLGREIAFKVLLPLDVSFDRSVFSAAEARFVREARITAQLDHPGIAPVHEVGRRASGELYATQKLVRGRTLAAALAGCSSLRDRLGLLQPFLGICQAVAYAHERGVIHRDLKPQNAMLGDLGEAVVLDWGIARTRGADKAADEGRVPIDSLLATGSGRTREGAVMGTPAYMSPEQAVGANAQVDERSDVWSLGVILYQLLTGHRPFEGRSTTEVLHAIATSPLLPVQSRCPEAPPELAAVAERALERDPSRRYPSAKELSAELAAWLSGGRVVAHEYTSWQLAKKFVQRNRAATVVALLGMAAVAVAAWGWRARYFEARHHLADALLGHARAAVDDLRWADAAVYYAASRAAEDRAEGRLGLALAEQRGPLPRFRTRVDEPVTSVGFLIDGRPALVAIVGARRDEDGEPIGAGRAEVRDARTGEPIARIGRERISHAWISPSGEFLVTASRESDTSQRALVERWQLPSGGALGGSQMDLPWPTLYDFRAVTSPDGSLLAVWEQAAPVVPTPSGSPVWRLSVRRVADGAEVLAANSVLGLVSFTPDGKSVAALDESGHPVRLDLATRQRASYQADPHPASSLVALAGDTTVLGYSDGAIRTSSERTSTSLPLFHRRTIANLTVNADGRRLASRSTDLTIGLWDRRNSLPLARITDAGWSSRLALSAEGSQLIVAHGRGEITVWDIPAPAMPAGLEAAHGMQAFAVSSDGRKLAAGNRRQPTRVFDVATGRQVASVPESSLFIWRQQLALSASGARLAVLGEKQIGVFEIEGPAGPRLLARMGGERPPIALSLDGERVVANDASSTTCWRASTGERLWSLPFEIASAAFTRDGMEIALGDIGGNAHLVDVATGRVRRTWQLRPALLAIAVSPDGGRIATGGDEGAWLIDAGSGRITELGRPPSNVWSMDFSPDARWLAMSGASFAVFDGRTGELLGRLPSDGLEGIFVAFTRDGALLHAGTRAIQRTELRDDTHGPPPEEALRDVLQRHRLRLVGQRVEQADATR